MLLITCPVCGQQADETEFHPGGEGHLVRPATHDPQNQSPEALHDYLFIRKNPRGSARELWLCARGCGKWFYAKRDTVTQQFAEFYPIQQPAPPAPPAPPKSTARTSGAIPENTAEPLPVAKQEKPAELMQIQTPAKQGAPAKLAAPAEPAKSVKKARTGKTAKPIKPARAAKAPKPPSGKKS